MTIQTNIQAREAADAVLQLALDEGKAVDDPALYFHLLHQRLGEIVGQEPTAPAIDPGAMTDEEARHWGAATQMPFGAHQGTAVNEVPLDYLLFIDGDKFRRDLGRYLRSEAVQREQE